jgi:hypothetical protein
MVQISTQSLIWRLTATKPFVGLENAAHMKPCFFLALTTIEFQEDRVILNFATEP